MSVLTLTSARRGAQVLALFAKVEYILPNLIVSSLTRETIRNAVDHGLEWGQIVAFLERNAHPLMAKNIPVLPYTVVNQVSLWALERKRLQPVAAKLYDAFDSLEFFDRAVQYSRDIGVYLWHRRDEERLHRSALAIAEHGHDRMRTFVKSQAQRSAS